MASGAPDYQRRIRPVPLSVSVPAGVDVTAQPAGVIAGMTSLPAGTNQIGEVKVTDGTDDLAINSDGAALVAPHSYTSPSSDQDNVVIAGRQITEDATVYTVTTGKTLYITDIHLSYETSNTANFQCMEILADATTVYAVRGDLTHYDASATSQCIHDAHLRTPLKFTTGQAVKIGKLVSAWSAINYTLIGWEE